MGNIFSTSHSDMVTSAKVAAYLLSLGGEEAGASSDTDSTPLTVSVLASPDRMAAGLEAIIDRDVHKEVHGLPTTLCYSLVDDGRTEITPSQMDAVNRLSPEEPVAIVGIMGRRYNYDHLMSDVDGFWACLAEDPPVVLQGAPDNIGLTVPVYLVSLRETRASSQEDGAYPIRSGSDSAVPGRFFQYDFPSTVRIDEPQRLVDYFNRGFYAGCLVKPSSVWLVVAYPGQAPDVSSYQRISYSGIQLLKHDKHPAMIHVDSDGEKTKLLVGRHEQLGFSYVPYGLEVDENILRLLQVARDVLLEREPALLSHQDVAHMEEFTDNILHMIHYNRSNL
jgi:hypothetical protein